LCLSIQQLATNRVTVNVVTANNVVIIIANIIAVVIAHIVAIVIAHIVAIANVVAIDIANVVAIAIANVVAIVVYVSVTSVILLVASSPKSTTSSPAGMNRAGSFKASMALSASNALTVICVSAGHGIFIQCRCLRHSSNNASSCGGTRQNSPAKSTTGATPNFLRCAKIWISVKAYLTVVRAFGNIASQVSSIGVAI
jgi:hypothetical protein